MFSATAGREQARELLPPLHKNATPFAINVIFITFLCNVMAIFILLFLY